MRGQNPGFFRARYARPVLMAFVISTMRRLVLTPIFSVGVTLRKTRDDRPHRAPFEPQRLVVATVATIALGWILAGRQDHKS